jgi:hypothetical protein
MQHNKAKSKKTRLQYFFGLPPIFLKDSPGPPKKHSQNLQIYIVIDPKRISPTLLNLYKKKADADDDRHDLDRVIYPLMEFSFQQGYFYFRRIKGK